jgi:hypothetical protein
MRGEITDRNTDTNTKFGFIEDEDYDNLVGKQATADNKSIKVGGKIMSKEEAYIITISQMCGVPNITTCYDDTDEKVFELVTDNPATKLPTKENESAKLYLAIKFTIPNIVRLLNVKSFVKYLGLLGPEALKSFESLKGKRNIKFNTDYISIPTIALLHRPGPSSMSVNMLIDQYKFAIRAEIAVAVKETIKSHSIFNNPKFAMKDPSFVPGSDSTEVSTTYHGIVNNEYAKEPPDLVLDIIHDGEKIMVAGNVRQLALFCLEKEKALLYKACTQDYRNLINRYKSPEAMDPRLITNRDVFIDQFFNAWNGVAMFRIQAISKDMDNSKDILDVMGDNSNAVDMNVSLQCKAFHGGYINPNVHASNNNTFLSMSSLIKDVMKYK